MAAAGNRTLHDKYRRIVNELDLYRREALLRGAENIPLSTREQLHKVLANPPARGARSAGKAA